MKNDYLVQVVSKTCKLFSIVSVQAKQEQDIEPSHQHKRQCARQRKTRGRVDIKTLRFSGGKFYILPARGHFQECTICTN